jgi:hypothetical protein
MTPSANHCRLCGRAKSAGSPVCRNCESRWLERIRQRRASRAAAERKRTQKRLDADHTAPGCAGPCIDPMLSVIDEKDQEKPEAKPKSLLRVGSSARNHTLQDALARNTFGHDGDSIWPVARLKGRRTHGTAPLMPAVLDQVNFLTPEHRDALLQAMWGQRKDICDLDAGALNALSGLWIRRARSQRSMGCSCCAAYGATAEGTGAGAAYQDAVVRGSWESRPGPRPMERL